MKRNLINPMKNHVFSEVSNDILQKKFIAVARPSLPTAEYILPYLQQIDQNHWYSNQGPLHNIFQERLGALWGVETGRIVLVTSATTGLSLALQAHNITHGKYCLVPSWTFAATASAIVNAGLTPHFLDVCPKTWSLDPSYVEYLAERRDIGAILVVAPFGAPLDLAEWDNVAERTGCPVIIDAAAAFDTLRSDGPMRPQKSTVVVSLHATKVFGVGEGGAVIARDPIAAERIRALTRFGFSGGRIAHYSGINAKISEYTAAVGLASLDCWAITRAKWNRVTELYKKYLPSTVTLPPNFGSSWVSSTLTVLCSVNSSTLQSCLSKHQVETVLWWGYGCHDQPAYTAYTREALPVTRDYAQRSVGLPFWLGIEEESIQYICNVVFNCLG